MKAVRVSSKYRITIPTELRERLGTEPGQRLLAFAVDNRIELVPMQPLLSMRGFLSGIDTSVHRQPDAK
jgi:AbrB family looped-hinge helix DNA binding protein